MLKPIAFYLPQFHPIPENDRWWGEGFTEWTNVKKAKPLFPGHEQPVEPGELGYYNLLDPKIRIKQAKLAKEHGIYGFCYWHYWFGNGKTLLEKPLQQVINSGEPDFPFCLGWANESWTGIWHGSPDQILMEQEYPGDEDIRQHFDFILPAITDSRYISVDGKPFFLIYRPKSHPKLERFIELFNKLAVKNGFDGFHFVAANVSEGWSLTENGFSAWVPPYHHRVVWGRRTNPLKRVIDWIRNGENVPSGEPEHVYAYSRAMKYFNPKNSDKVCYPIIVPNWDNSPRSGERAVIFTGSTPKLFKQHLEEALQITQINPRSQQIVMIKSWNEWAEGNYIEPDKKWGRAYLETMHQVLMEKEKMR